MAYRYTLNEMDLVKLFLFEILCYHKHNNKPILIPIQ